MTLELLPSTEVEQIFDIVLKLLRLNDAGIIVFTRPNIPGYKRTVRTLYERGDISLATVTVDGWRITSAVEIGYQPDTAWHWTVRTENSNSSHFFGWQSPTTSIRYGGQRVLVQYLDDDNCFGCRRTLAQFVLRFS